MHKRIIHFIIDRLEVGSITFDLTKMKTHDQCGFRNRQTQKGNHSPTG